MATTAKATVPTEKKSQEKEKHPTRQSLGERQEGHVLRAGLSLQSLKATVKQVHSEERMLISSGRLNVEASYRKVCS